MTLEMLLSWLRGALLLVLSVAALAFGVHLTVFGYDAATVLPIHHVDRCHLQPRQLYPPPYRWLGRQRAWIIPAGS